MRTVDVLIRLLGIIVFIPLITVAAAAGQSASGPVVISDVTVINPANSSVTPNATVVVTGNRISEVSASARANPPKNAHFIKGKGQYLIPGLWDMHVHIRGSMLGNKGSFLAENESMLPLYVANGVTGVREMGGDMVDTCGALAEGHQYRKTGGAADHYVWSEVGWTQTSLAGIDISHLGRRSPRGGSTCAGRGW